MKPLLCTLIYLGLGTTPAAEPATPASTVTAFAMRLPCPIYVRLLDKARALQPDDAMFSGFVNLVALIYTQISGATPDDAVALAGFSESSYKICQDSPNLMFYDAATQAWNLH